MLRGRTAKVRQWVRTRSGPSPTDRAPRVEVTPPTPPPTSKRDALRRAIEDIDVVLEHDPAARSAMEVILTYPGLHAIWLHRIAHGRWRRGHVLGPRVLAHLTRFMTGIEIHPGATLGRRVFIDHGMGIVIGETARVGDDCLLYKGVVLGGTSLERTERHPTLGKGVVVGTNACVLGPIQIGDGARVGSNSVVIRDVPAASTVVGVPGKVAGPGRRAQMSLYHANLPDPVAQVVQELVDELEALRVRVRELEEGRVQPRMMGRTHELSALDDDA